MKLDQFVMKQKDQLPVYTVKESEECRVLSGIIISFTFLFLLEARALTILRKGPASFEIFFLFTVVILYCLAYLFLFRKEEFFKPDLLCAASALLVSGAILFTSFIHEQKGSLFASGKDAVLFCFCACFFYLMFFCVKHFWLCDFEISSSRDKRPHTYVYISLIFGFILFKIYMIFYPYLSSPDTINQWNQIHGLLSYNRIHSIGHTIFLKGLLSIYDDYIIVILFQLVGVFAVYLLFSNYFLSKGFPLWSVAAVFAVSLITDSTAQLTYSYPFKDTPAALCICLITLILMKYNEEYKISSFSSAVLGFALAWCWLFRLNGVIAFCVMGTYFVLSFIKRRYFRQLSLMLAAIILSVSFVNFYADKCLKPAEYENGFSIQVFASGIAAMVDSGELSDEELDKIDELISVDWMKSHYSRYNKNPLIWEHDDPPFAFDDPNLEIFNNKFVLDLGANKWEVVKLYFELMPKHLSVCIKDVFSSLRMMWSTPLMFASSYLFLVITIAFLAVGARLKLKDSIVFLPSLCNTVSIMISTITNESRYLLPAYMLMPVFFLYVVQKNSEYKEQKC